MAKVPRFPRRRSRVAFVLSGGGNLGAIQVGMLAALADRGVVPDLVVGCSVGALNGGAFAADPTVEGVAHLADQWRLIAAAELMPSSWVPASLQLFRKGNSLSANGGLRETISTLLGQRDRFDELVVPFQCVATDVDSGGERWFSEGELVEPILASAALPAVYPMVTIEGRRYFDGGVVNNVPVARAIELGARKVYVLHVGPHGRPNPEVRRPLDAALIAYWIARNSRFARDLAEVPKGVEVIVLPPGRRPDIRYDDFDQTEQLLAQGRDNARNYLDELDALDDDPLGRERGDANDDGAVDRPNRAERLAEDLRHLIDELRERVGDRVAERRGPDEDPERTAVGSDDERPAGEPVDQWPARDDPGA